MCGTRVGTSHVRLRQLASSCMAQHRYSAAAFFADKLVAFSSGNPMDVFLLAQAYMASNQHRRALQLLRTSGNGTLLENPQFKHLAACCLVECKEWEECLVLLGDDIDSPSDLSADYVDLGGTANLQASLSLLRATAFDALGNRPRAKDCYQLALLQDAYCYEAYQSLFEGHMLTWEEEAALLSRLKVHPEDGWLTTLLAAKASKYNPQQDMPRLLTELEAPVQEETAEAATHATTAPCDASGQPFQPAQHPTMLTDQGGNQLPGSFPSATPSHLIAPPGALAGAAREGVGALPFTPLPGPKWYYPAQQAEHAQHAQQQGLIQEGLPVQQQQGLLQRGELSEQQQQGRQGQGLDHTGVQGMGCTPMQPMQRMQPMQGQPPHPGQGDGSPVHAWGLGSSLDVQACRAEWLLHRGLYEECFALTSQLMQADRFASQVLPLYGASAAVLGKGPQLFALGHALVRECPTSAMAWYMVGCYYICTGQHEVARRHLAKATALDPGCAPAWLAYGHAFSLQDERDQAMAAYRTAYRLFPGLHQPLLGMGLEYMSMNNLELAERMLLAAHELCPSDPAPCHELGVLQLKGGALAAARMWLSATVRLATAAVAGLAQAGKEQVASRAALLEAAKRLPSRWEPSVLAMGHVLRKQGALEEAVQWYRAALCMLPQQPGTLSALGFTLQLMGRCEEAAEAYHKALAVRPQDEFASSMLTKLLVEYAAQ